MITDLHYRVFLNQFYQVYKVCKKSTPNIQKMVKNQIPNSMLGIIESNLRDNFGDLI